MLDNFWDLFKQACLSSSHILLTGPISPDADSLASCLALRRVIMAIGGKEPVIVGEVPFRYRNLCDIGLVQQSLDIQRENFSLAVVLDGDRGRLEKRTTHLFDQAEKKAIIDHHSSTQNDGYDYFGVDQEACSTTELIYHLMCAWNVPMNQQLAELIYAGLIYDTGGFCFENTSSRTLRLAAQLLDTGFSHTKICTELLQERTRSGLKVLGHALREVSYLCAHRVVLCSLSFEAFTSIQGRSDDIDGIVEMLLATVGVEVAVLWIEFAQNQHKISFRSRSGSSINVALLAQRIMPTGGGHKRAAGLRVHKERDILAKILLQELEALYG